MEIGGYAFLHEEERAPRSAGQRENMPAVAGISLPSLNDEHCSEHYNLSETMRTRIRTHLAEVHSAQEEFSLLREEEKHIKEAEKLYQQVGELLRKMENDEKTGKTDQLYTYLGKVRDLLTKLKPDLSADELKFEILAFDREILEEKDAPPAMGPQKPLEKELIRYAARLEEQRNKLSTRQKELIDAIAHNLIAVENITATGAAIRDEDYAQQVMAELREALTDNKNLFPLRTNLQNITALLLP